MLTLLAGVLVPLALSAACPPVAAAATEAMATAQPPAAPLIAAALQRRLPAGGERIRIDGGSFSIEPLRAFYAARQFQPLWVDEYGPNDRARDLKAIIRDAETSLRLPSPLPAPPENGRSAAPGDPEKLADLELAHAGALLTLARTLRSGAVSPASVDPEYALTPPPFDATATLISAADAATLRAHLARLEPQDPTYRGLERALAEARRLAANVTSWPRLPDGPALRPGESRETVPAIRKMLSVWGDYHGPASASKLYDDALVQAVRRFQARHGLEPDGVIGSQTRAALNVAPADRVRQIVVNRERWRWMPRDLGDPHVLVNMAGFELQVIDTRRPPETMRVVVGQPFRRTPVFSDEITYLEFNPTWTVPKTIFAEDLLPKIRRNPAMLEAQGITVLARGTDGAYAVNPNSVDWNAVGGSGSPYRLRQEPGPKNPLGRVKFMFPNDFSVYLHDTPKRELFARSQRAFSSGCIRVEKPLELAENLLEATPGWDRARIDAVIERGKTRTVTLAQPVPIHLVYLTAWLGTDGELQFREDLYGRDNKLLQIIFKNGA
ncbi:MAG: L,D-transpeptidase family protein [Rhodospirillales bacterium]|jgi:murein L,D-transpeptidase YcbB/YkuD|nr:L,D-transpeptidase family protein [Rhodospirillales bacterium]